MFIMIVTKTYFSNTNSNVCTGERHFVSSGLQHVRNRRVWRPGQYLGRVEQKTALSVSQIPNINLKSLLLVGRGCSGNNFSYFNENSYVKWKLVNVLRGHSNNTWHSWGLGKVPCELFPFKSVIYKHLLLKSHLWDSKFRL